MENIAALIAQAKAGGRESASAIEKLKAMGAVAAPAIIEEIRRSPLDQIKLFSEILEAQALDLQILPVLLPLLKDDSPPVKLAAHQALRKLKDPRSVPPLLDTLLDDTLLEFTRALAARTLGDVNDDHAVNGLLIAARKLTGETATSTQFGSGIRWAAEEMDEDKLRLAIEIAVALAKLGHQEMYPVIASMISSHCSNERIQDSTICSEAVAALAYVVGPGVLQALRLAVQSGDAEVQAQAVDPLRYLGTREAVAVLIEIAKDKNESVAEEAFAAIYDVTSELPGGVEEVQKLGKQDLQEWWSRTQKRFQPGICYRLGKPIDLLTLINLLARPEQRNQVLAELRVITGDDFSNDRRDEISTWYTQNKERFRRGRLYKFGYEQDFGTVV